MLAGKANAQAGLHRRRSAKWRSKHFRHTPNFECFPSRRSEIIKILNRDDDRLMVIVGPCSIHDVNAAIEYAKKLYRIKDKVKQNYEGCA